MDRSGRTGGWPARLGKTARALGIIAIVLALAGTTLARYDVIAKLPGFTTVAIGLLLAILALALGLVALIAGRRRAGLGRGPALVGIGAAVIYLAVIASYLVPASGYPSIHDATTDLADPPEFRTLALRPDNLVGVGTLANWRRIHARAFPDLQPVVVAKPVAQVIADAERLARARGWTIAHADPQAGVLEATAYAGYIRFRDDVVLRVVPGPKEGTSRVDMRSVSRVGGGDLGYNANRVRDFLKDLAAA